MASKHWSRIEAMASAPPLKAWPDVHLSALEGGDKEMYLSRKAAITMYADGTPGADVQLATGINSKKLPMLLKRCLAIAEDGRIFGFRGLIPWVRLNGYTRKAANQRKFPQAKGGKAGMLQKTLKRFPDLEAQLVVIILKKRKKGVAHEFKISPSNLHREFLKKLEELGVQKTEWPFDTSSQGRRSISSFMKELLDRNFSRAVNVREEQTAKAHLATGTGKAPLISFQNRPYSAVEIDAHKIQAFFTVVMETPEGTKQHVVLERLWLLVIVCRESSAVINYSIVYSSEVTADDVLQLIRRAVSETWSPKELTIPGLNYPKNGGLPSGVIPEYDGALWSATLLDGALAHLSNNVKEVCRKNLGLAINWGPVAHFERRPNVERLFKSIEDRLFLRLPSTSGSRPGKGRASDAEGAAVHHKIVVEEVRQLLDVSIAQYNSTETAGLSYMSPIEYLRFYVDENRAHFRVRRLPQHRRALKDAIPIRITRTVKGGRSTGRRPYIQLDDAHYTNDILVDSGHLVGQALTLEINEEDYRHVRAYLPNGAELGILTVEERWRTKHSRTMRKLINRLKNRRELTLTKHDDPVAIYMKFLLTPKEAVKPGSKKSKQPISRRAATRALQVSEEGNLPLKINPTPTTVPPLQRPASAPLALRRPLPDLKNLINRRK